MYVGYIRVSSKSQEDNTSLRNQGSKIRDYCQLYNLEIVKMFKDISSGSNIKRKGYASMLRYIKKEENDIKSIIVFKADRLHRSLHNLLNMLNEIESIKVNFISVTEQFNTEKPEGKLILHMLGSFAEFERKMILERTSKGKQVKMDQLEYVGGRLPLGYKAIDSKIKIDVETAKIVKLIYKLRLKKWTMKTIRGGLKSINFKSNNKYLSISTIRYILRNDTYLGTYRYGNYTINIPPIITNHIFDTVQKTFRYHSKLLSTTI